MKTKILLILPFLLKLVLVNSQEIKINKANQDYEKFAYVNAVKTYEKVAEKGYKSVELFQKLGNAYYFQGKLQEANNWYSELFNLSQDLDKEYFFRFSQTLKAVGNYEKANQIMSQFNQNNKLDSRGLLAKNQNNYIENIKKNTGKYQIMNAGINTEFSDYGTAFYNDELVFTSAREVEDRDTKRHSWTNQPFTNLLCVYKDGDSLIGTPKLFSEDIASKFNESTAVFTKDGTTIYFTRNNFINGKKGKDKNQTVLLKIYRATKENNHWINLEELPFNSDNYNVAHPALSPDEKTLYFASDMPGTFGASDIFKVKINEDGSFGIPENLGNKINTEARETFPFVSEDNKLYFSSDGLPGLGGLDVFVTDLNNNVYFGITQNMGEPINSSMDDFAFIIDSQLNYGYVSSNRKEDNLGYDDIYIFTATPSCKQQLKGIVIDKNSKKPLIEAKISLYDKDGNVLKSMISDSNGNYEFGDIDCGLVVKIRAEKLSYNINEVTLNIPNESGMTFQEVELELQINSVKIGDDLRNSLGIDIIYFDLDKSNIRPDAEVELAKIVEIMKQYPNMKIDIRSHTDCRQTFSYNMSLSDRRAKATIKWLIDNGIDKKRLTGKGYGESQLVNDCGCEPTNESVCSEDEHQKNRRSEFIIVKL